MTTTDTTTPTEPATVTDEVVDTYIAMWNELDPVQRAALIEQAWAPGATYRDPLLAADGYEGLSAMVETVHQHYPGQRFARLTAVDQHNGVARFGWNLAAPDGAVTVAGIDVADVAPDGRLQRITGFFGDLA
jgi:hypothetical protein